jgi:hypothetical protein
MDASSIAFSSILAKIIRFVETKKEKCPVPFIEIIGSPKHHFKPVCF